MILREGFYTALGTPVDQSGAIVEASLVKQLECQIENGASGALLLGSMGMQPAIASAECVRAAKIASRAAEGKMPLFVGVMDNSVARVRERTEALKGLKLTGVVMTAPYYFVTDNASLTRFFTAVADTSPYPVYLYDLPGVTKHKLTYPMVCELAKHKNILGIKTADTHMLLRLIMEGSVKKEFTALYSGLDTMDIGFKHGLTRYLDGMFAATPRCAHAMQTCVAANDLTGAAAQLQKILSLRDTMAKIDIFPAFTAAMNLLGFAGRFSPDYHAPVSEESIGVLRQALRDIGEL